MVLIRLRFAIGLATLAILSSIGIVGAMHTSAAMVLPQANSDGVRRITPEEVRDLWKKDKAVLVDVRGSSAYKAGHIKGALDIPANDIGQRANELPKDKMIITYCS